MEINARNSPLFAQGKAKWDAFVQTYKGTYDLTPAIYAGMNKKIAFRCPVHGAMQMDAKNMMAGKQCVKCAFAARAGRTRMTLGKVVEKFNAAHSGKYSYEHVKYSGQQTPVAIHCLKHGPFYQKPEYHWYGAGCPKCFHEERRGATQKDTLTSFVPKAEAIFNGLFDYSVSVYQGSQKHILVRCVKHNTICETKPNWLLNGANPCPSCNHMRSAGEQAIFNLLSAWTKAEQRNRTLIKPKELDIYIPSHNIAVEYCGDFWHSLGSPEDVKAKKDAHWRKYQDCKALGIRLLTIYESEWLERQYAIRRLLRNAVGKTRGRLMARKCELRTVEPADARAFYERYHPQGGDGAGEHYGLFWRGKLVACMRFTFGANDRGNTTKRVWTLTRYATRVTVAGAASRLFKAFLAAHQPQEVKSFSDNRYFEGGMYEQLGFVLEEEVSPDYQVWSPKLGLRPKTHYQRRNIPAKLKEHGLDEIFDPDTDPRTEAEMTYLMGCRRLYDCGKRRWVWRA